MTIRNLLSQLGRLEQKTSDGLSEGSTLMLITMLGKLDAMFYPWRRSGSFRGAVAVLCNEYRAGRYGLAARGAGLEQWKSASNERAQLQAAGLANPITANSQTVGLTFTPEGMTRARALTGTLAMARLGVLLLKRKESEWRNGWCSENTIFGQELDGDPSQWEHLTDMMLPALVAGCLKANCDCDGRVYYRVENEEAPIEPACDRKAEQWAADAYVAAFKTERRALQALEDNDGIVIPVPRGGY